VAQNLAQKLIRSHLVAGTLAPGEEIALSVDQTLLQDVLGTLVMLELEAMGIERIKVSLAAQYVDHNLVQNDHLNADETCFCEARAGGSAFGTVGPATVSAIPSICNVSASQD